jgi:hypothetical protein
MKPIIAIVSLAALAACGADGEPTPPQVAGQVTMSSSGVSIGTWATLKRGPFRLGVGGGL